MQVRSINTSVCKCASVADVRNGKSTYRRPGTLVVALLILGAVQRILERGNRAFALAALCVCACVCTGEGA